MVYRIRPHADHLNRGIDLDYQRSPDAGPSWVQYVMKATTVSRESGPTLIVSARPAPLPDAFLVSTDFWCVSAPVRDFMTDLFGSQVTFYEVPVVYKAGNAPLPPTWFVAFTQFCGRIDWQRATLVSGRHRQAPEFEAITLADVPMAAVFQALPDDSHSIWIEKTLREGNRVFSPGLDVYTTDTAGRALADAFPNTFVMRQHEQAKTLSEMTR